MTDFLDKLKILVGGEPHTFQQLGANNFIVGDDTVGFEAPESGEFQLTHHYSGHVVADLPVRSQKGRPGYQVTLLRGRNIFRVAPAGLEFSLYFKSAMRDWTESILKAFVILLVIQTFVVQTFFIPTGSMKNTLFPGDYIMVEKLTYRAFDPDPGEIVVFEFPDDVSKDFIKRLIATGGDTLMIRGGAVTRNGTKMPEKFTVFKKRLANDRLQAALPSIGDDQRDLSDWPKAPGLQKSYSVKLHPRLARLPDLDVDSLEQADVAYKRQETAADVDKKPGSYHYDPKTLELTIHARGGVSINSIAAQLEAYFRFTHDDSEATAELEQELFGETGRAEDRLIRLPDDHLWAMGDNRNNSADSRFWENPLRRRGLMGKGLLVYWPPSHMGMIRHLHFGK